MRESPRFSNSHSALKFYSSVIKSWKLWPSSCLYVKNLWRRMVTYFLGLQHSEHLSITEVLIYPLLINTISTLPMPAECRHLKYWVLQLLVSCSCWTKLLFWHHVVFPVGMDASQMHLWDVSYSVSKTSQRRLKEGWFANLWDVLLEIG